MKDRNCRNELNRLKNRLFGVNGADCLNLGNSDGLLEQIKQRLNDDIINRLVAKIEDLDNEIKALKKPKRKR
ncbi:hypothetical protein KAI04_04140 [Candidatus Pacearchaeota archaeon]|nr:hypothetical protein [Candidatus Pacearchaeota archaeon]